MSGGGGRKKGKENGRKKAKEEGEEGWGKERGKKVRWVQKYYNRN